VRYIIADPDEKSCADLKKILDDYEMLDFQGSFTTMEATENSINKGPLDIAFIRMGKVELNTYKLASEIRGMNPFSKVILLSNYQAYAVEAFEYEANGFLLIPYDGEKIEHLLQKWMEKSKD